MSQHLYFNIGQESRPVIEKLTEQNVKESLFFEQYKNAFDSLSSYLKVSKTKDEEENRLTISLPLLVKEVQERHPVCCLLPMN